MKALNIFLILIIFSLNAFSQVDDPKSVVKEYFNQLNKLPDADSPDGLLDLISPTFIDVSFSGKVFNYEAYKEDIIDLFKSYQKAKIRNGSFGKSVITDYLKTITDNNTAVVVIESSTLSAEKAKEIKFIFSFALTKENGAWKISFMQVTKI